MTRKTSISLMCAAGLLIIAQAASANLPASQFPPIDPMAQRIPVTLVAAPLSKDSVCPGIDVEFQLVDATGKVWMAPFVVPENFTFVATDLAWSATSPQGSPFDPQYDVTAIVISNIGGKFDGGRIKVPSQQVTGQVATGSYAFAQGPAYVEGTTLCLAVLQAQPVVIPAWEHTSSRLHGFLVPN